MKKLIRKILREEVDKDVDGDNFILNVNYKELQLLSYIIKNDGAYKYTFKQLGISNLVLMSKMFLILKFNTKEDILKSLETKDTSNLYLGPFYTAKVDYYDEIYEDEETVEDECEYCNGTGYDEESCYNCGGSGEVEDGDEDYVTCSDCGGSGEIEDECGYCGGSGYDEYTQELEKIDLFTLPVFSKTPIIFDDLVDEHKSTITKLGMVKGRVKFIEIKTEPKSYGGIEPNDEERIDHVYDEGMVLSGDDLSEYI